MSLAIWQAFLVKGVLFMCYEKLETNESQQKTANKGGIC